MTNKRLCVAICAAIMTIGMMSGCGNVDDTSSAKPKTTSADSLVSSDSSFAETSKKSVMTTTTTSDDDSSSKVTTTSIVTGTDRNGKVTTLIIGEGGRILSTFKNGSTTSKTTTKADAKTTTTKRDSSNSNQNGGGNSGGNSNNNNGNSGNNGGGGNSGYNSPTQTDPPQTESPKTTTRKPEPKPTQTTTEKPKPQPDKNIKDLPIEEKINSCNFDDLTTAYLKFGCGKANIEISDYEWQLIRQDMIDYGFENIEGKTEFFREDPFGDYTITFPYPVHLIVNESYEGESHAHYDVWTSEYFYGGYYSDVLKAENEEQMLEVAEKVRNSVRPTLEWAVESFYWTTDSTGAYDDPDIAEIACTIEYNFGMMDDGSVWFLTE